MSVCAFIFASEIKMEVSVNELKFFGAVFSLVALVSELKLVATEVDVSPGSSDRQWKVN